MKTTAKAVLLAATVVGLTACAANTAPELNDGVAEAAPVGTHVKTRTVYRRGGSSSSVKVMTRENVDSEGATADDVLKPD